MKTRIISAAGCGGSRAWPHPHHLLWKLFRVATAVESSDNIPPVAATWHWEMSVTKTVTLQGLVGKPCPKGREDAATIGERNVGKVHCRRRCHTLEQTCSLCCRFRFLCEWFKWARAWVIQHHWIWQVKIYHTLMRSNTSFKVDASSKLNKAESRWSNPYIKCCLYLYFVCLHSP